MKDCVVRWFVCGSVTVVARVRDHTFWVPWPMFSLIA